MAAMVRQREFDPRFAYPVRVPHPRLQMPISLHVAAAHPPPDPYLSRTPGVGEYDPQYTFLSEYPTAPHVTIRKDETWRTAIYPDGTKRFSGAKTVPSRGSLIPHDGSLPHPHAQLASGGVQSWRACHDMHTRRASPAAARWSSASSPHSKPQTA
jgi:hypothetical protein